jgi:toluene monooxygenase system protein E
MQQGPLTAEKLRTWSRLSNQRRKPSEYDVVSTDIHFTNDFNWTDHQLRSIAKDQPLNEYYRKYLTGSPLKFPDADNFRDPDEITYRSYNILQEGQERYVEEVLNRFSEEEHDDGLSAEWLRVLARAFAPGRYLVHTVQIGSAYEVQISPTSPFALCCAFQSGDALRVVSHIAYRTAELRNRHPSFGFGERERELWEKDPAWQSYRELMEKCLIAYDWGETFVALNLVAKPAIDEGFTRQLGRAARRNNDMVLSLLSDSHLKDVDRSRNWAGAFTRFLLTVPENRAVIEGWVAKWRPLAERAVREFCAVIDPEGTAANEAIEACSRLRINLGLVG